MITAILAHLMVGENLKETLLEGIPAEARVAAGSVIDTFTALSNKEGVALRRTRSFRAEVAKIVGNRYPTPEWTLGEDAYLFDTTLRLRFQISGLDATMDKGAIRVFVRFQRFVDKKDVAGSFGVPGKVLTAAETLQDTYTLRQQGATWRLSGYERVAMKSGTEVKP